MYMTIPMGFKASAHAYAKAHGLTLLNFRLHEYSGELYAVAVQQSTDICGEKHYSFGRLYYVGPDFVYDQCGCYSTTDEKEVRMAAYKFFSIN